MFLELVYFEPAAAPEVRELSIEREHKDGNSAKGGISMRAFPGAVLFALILVLAWLTLTKRVSMGKVASDKSDSRIARNSLQNIIFGAYRGH